MPHKFHLYLIAFVFYMKVIAVGSHGSFYDKVQGKSIEDAEIFKKELSDEVMQPIKPIILDFPSYQLLLVVSTVGSGILLW